jgi:hypothetical protein
MAFTDFGIVFLVGVALGLRFKFMILFPAISFAVIGVVVVGIANGNHIGPVVLTIVLVSVALQIGYFFGLLARGAIASLGTRERNPAVVGKFGLR